MKRKKAWILCLAVVFLLVCGLGLGVVKYRSDISSAWQEGYDLGYRDGSSSGYNRGYDAGTSGVHHILRNEISQIMVSLFGKFKNTAIPR